MEEWSFTIYVPPHVTTGQPKEDEKADPGVGVIRLSHLQAKQPPKTMTGEQQKALRGDSKETLEEEVEEDDEEGSALLRPADNNIDRRRGHNSQKKNGPARRGGGPAAVTTTTTRPAWIFRSPYWSLASSELLTVTFCAAWQNLPEYTNYSRGGCGMAALCCSWCCSSSSSTPDDRIDYVSQTFRTTDIVRVEMIETESSPLVGFQHFNEKQQKSGGAGGRSLSRSSTTSSSAWSTLTPQKRLRLYLRPLQYEAVEHVVPPYLRDAWDAYRQKARSLHPRQHHHHHHDSTTNDTTTIAGDKGITKRAKDHHDDDDDQQQHYVILEFVFATHLQDPPLLSKVHLPAKEGFPLCIKTITVLNGHFHRDDDNNISSSTSRAAAAAPPSVPSTHIYINGYQSWSFTGSVAKALPQPKSGLPQVFSGAFNRGGLPPPPAAQLFSSSPDHHNNNNNDDDNNKNNAVVVGGGCPVPLPSCAAPTHYQSDFFACITSDGRVFRSSRFLRRELPPKFPFQELDETGGPALLLGWLSQRHQFGIVQADADLQRFQMHCSVDGQLLMAGAGGGGGNINNGRIVTDWSYLQLVHPHSYDEEPMAAYLHHVAANNDARPLMNGTLLTGWCSWYVFYENINAGLLRENFGRLASMRSKVPTNVAVVDDGYMTAWGDWNSLKPKAFPGGLEAVARDIVAQSMRPGLWLAPYAADKHSVLAKLHPDWIIRNDAGRPANSSHCGKFFYGLDATNPAVRQYVKATVGRAVHDWGFNVLKIDFLYAACLDGNGKYDPTMSRAEAMDLALRTIREAAGPNVFLIGCGCPIGSAIGYIDAMRISADTGPTWRPSFPLPKWDNGTLPSLRSMIRNSISRAPFGHRWWHNDPDCIMLGKHTRLTDVEVASAATVVAMTCGMLLLSDDLPKVSNERMSIVAKIFPLTGITATVLDLHSSNDGLPSLMRLWCTDKYDLHGSVDIAAVATTGPDDKGNDPNIRATLFGRQASMMADSDDDDDIVERRRNCIHVTKGLGTWTILSVSNWSDGDAIVRVPPPALKPPPVVGWSKDEDCDCNQVCGDEFSASCGFHVFGFWQSKYQWLPDPGDGDDEDHIITKTLRAHESEILHIKKVTRDWPQYIGSTIHFSCGYELLSFKATDHSVRLLLPSNYQRHGDIYVYVPRVNVEEVVHVQVNNRPRSPWSIAGSVPSGPRDYQVIGRILKIPISIECATDGEVQIDF